MFLKIIEQVWDYGFEVLNCGACCQKNLPLNKAILGKKWTTSGKPLLPSAWVAAFPWMSRKRHALFCPFFSFYWTNSWMGKTFSCWSNQYLTGAWKNTCVQWPLCSTAHFLFLVSPDDPPLPGLCGWVWWAADKPLAIFICCASPQATGTRQRGAKNFPPGRALSPRDSY